ncbi:uncharacterized protein LOC131332656 [Rhododendron vialii]|uniref:uncharacterized protein LOC131332656 n=1 Tax=Rhododendron vialii TaxID=182163 RepID=UPI00265DD257|nr:uncharacterized protein LOC131332656 [Rhododendron vialii]
MATPYGTFLPEGQSSNRPPLFSGTNYNYWKARMRIYIQTDYKLWRIIVDGPHRPTKTVNGVVVFKEEKEWDANDVKGIELNAKAMNLLYCALDPNEFNRVSTCESAKEIWDKLEVTHEGTSQVKESKIDMLVHKYELFKMQPDESISDMFTRFTDIINGLKSLGKSYSNVDLVRKILRSLPKQWEPKVTAIIEAKQDLTNYSLDELLGSLMTHEITMNLEDNGSRKKKDLAFKISTSSTSSESEDDSESSDDEDLAVITRKLKKSMTRKMRRAKRILEKDGSKGENSKKRDIICYECKRPGHLKSQCPEIKKSMKTAKRRAMLAALREIDRSSSEENSDQEVANLCLMAHGEEEVNSSDDFDEQFTYDELLDAFEELHSKFKNLSSKYKSLKKTNFSLLAENECLKNEKDALKGKIEEVCSPKEIANDLVFQNNLRLENDVLKNEVEDLKTSLSKFVQGKENLDMLLGKQRCVFDKVGIGFNPTKKQKFYQNLFVKSTSSSHSYTSCNYCGMNGHLSYSCPIRKNMSVGTKKIWVPKHLVTNLHGPKQSWVPKNYI